MKKVFLFILLCGCLALSGTLKAAEGQLMAGTAKINITPKQNIPLHDSAKSLYDFSPVPVVLLRIWRWFLPSVFLVCGCSDAW